jgi:LacI family transcriptional regulator
MKKRTQKPPTMNDVAQEAGVTQATVSYVLNNSGDISDPVKKRVLDAADKLGYIPNIVARNLKMNRTKTIGIIVPDVMNSYYDEIIKHTERITREHGYFTFICNALHNPEVEDWYVTTLIQHKVAGVIVAYGMTNTECLRKLMNYDIPFVVLDDDMERFDADVPCVLVNNMKGSFLAVQHFISMGISKIAFCSEPLYNQALMERYEGFRQAMGEFGLTLNEDLISIASEEVDNDKLTLGYMAAEEILSRQKPRGIFATTDQLAFGVLKKLYELKIRVPDEIAVVGYDNVPFSAVISPSLTTINQPVMTMCIQGTGMLLNRIAGDKDTRRRITLEPSIVIRDSAP